VYRSAAAGRSEIQPVPPSSTKAASAATPPAAIPAASRRNRRTGLAALEVATAVPKKMLGRAGAIPCESPPSTTRQRQCGGWSTAGGVPPGSDGSEFLETEAVGRS